MLRPVNWASEMFDGAITWIVAHVPGWTVALIALFFYPVLGLIVPLWLRWPVIWLVDANVIGTALAASFGLGWLGAVVEQARRRHLVDWTSSLRNLDWQEFEWAVGEMFRRQGWRVKETGRGETGDRNIDLELERKGQRKLVQCKQWKAYDVPVDEIRRFIGTLSIAGLSPSDGIFVTSSTFTEAARSEADSAHLQLLDGRALFNEMEKVRQGEPCPVCGKKMRLDHSVHGWWLRCVETGCKGKRDLGMDAGRAVEFLTESR